MWRAIFRSWVITLKNERDDELKEKHIEKTYV